jgi:hypothetical protein
MPNFDYFRKQAELCSQLADVSSGDDLARRFKLLALDMLLKAADAMDELDESTAVAGRGAPGTISRIK